MDDALIARLATLRAAAPALQHAANNAVMVVTANLELLSRSAPTEAARRQAGRALDATQRLDATLRAFLALMRATPGEKPVAAPAETIPSVLPLLRAVLGSRTPVEMTLAGADTPVAHDAAAAQVALLALALAVAGKGEAGVPLDIAFLPAEPGLTLRATPPATGGPCVDVVL
jgi:hypothetical protein